MIMYQYVKKIAYIVLILVCLGIFQPVFGLNTEQFRHLGVSFVVTRVLRHIGLTREQAVLGALVANIAWEAGFSDMDSNDLKWSINGIVLGAYLW